MTTTLEQRHRSWRIPIWFGACAFLAIALFFLWEEHRAHILGALPYLLLLACPILHFLMHGRHHGGHHGHSAADDGAGPREGERHEHRT
jgi:hypothetical protein